MTDATWTCVCGQPNCPTPSRFECQTPPRCYDCGEVVTSPYMPVYLTRDGAEARRPSEREILTQFCLTCAHWRYWAAHPTGDAR